MQENIVSHGGRKTLLLGPGAPVLLAALKESNTISGSVDTSAEMRSTVYASRLTSVDAASMVRTIIEHGAKLTIDVQEAESDNALLNSILAVAKIHGSTVNMEGVAVSTEALSEDDIHGMQIVAQLTDAISLRKVPAGEGVDYLIVIPSVEQLPEALLAYTQALDTIKDTPHLVVLPKMESVDELSAAFLEHVTQCGGFVTDDPETFQILTHEAEVSTEGFKDIFQKVIDFFKPLPEDHIDKVTKRIKRSLFWSANIDAQNHMLNNLLDHYLTNPEWLGKQGFKKGNLSSRDFANISTGGSVVVDTLVEGVNKSITAMNQMTEDFAAEAKTYVRDINKRVPYIDGALTAASLALEPDSTGFLLAIGAAQGNLNGITPPIRVINFRDYVMVGYNSPRALSTPPEAVSFKATLPCLDADSFATACKALREVTKVEPVLIGPEDYVIRGLSPIVVKALGETDSGRRLLNHLSTAGFYTHSGWSRLPDVYTLRQRLVIGILTWLVGSLDIKSPRL